MSYRSLLFIICAVITIFFLDQFFPPKLYSFGGHGWTISAISRGVLCLLAITHIILSGVMWMQHKYWTQSEASMFRFMCFKAIFWAYVASHTPASDLGIDLVSTFFLVLMVGLNLDLDIRLVGRYVFGWEDAYPHGILKEEVIIIEDDYGIQSESHSVEQQQPPRNKVSY